MTIRKTYLPNSVHIHKKYTYISRKVNHYDFYDGGNFFKTNNELTIRKT